MPTTDSFGRDIPDDGESPDIPGAFGAYSLSSPPGPLTVSSRAQANAILAATGSPVGLHVWRTDTNQEERWNGTGWEYVAGRQHGATVQFARTGVPENEPHRLPATQFSRASAGWRLNGEAWLVVPQSGMYLMTADVNVSGTAAQLGRQFVQFTLRGSGAANSPFGFRASANTENNYGITTVWPLSEGDQLQVQVFHTGGGPRTYGATLQIAMINAPNW